MIKELQPREAYALLQQNADAVLIDVRSTMEYEYVGRPLNAVHVPIKEPPAWETAPDFVDNVRAALKGHVPEGDIETTPLLMLCRSGKRSELGAELLIQAGFTDVANILEGFEGDKDPNGHRSTINGWRFHQLPWEQS